MLRRRLGLVQALGVRRRGATVATLMNSLGVSRSTIYRDIEELEASGIPLSVDRVNGEARYSLAGDGAALVLRPLEVAALRLARQLLEPLEGVRAVDELDRLLLRVANATPIEPEGSISVPVSVAPHTPGAARALDMAIREGHRIAFRYRGATDEIARRRVVDPVALRLHRHQLYLVAFDPEKNDWRIFKTSRIEGDLDLSGPADPHPDYDEADLFAGSAGIWSGEVIEVAVRLEPSVARYANEWPLTCEQLTESEPTGSVVVRARVAGLEEPLRWVLSWGAAATVLAPPELRAAARDELAAAVANYGSPDNSVSHDRGTRKE